MAPQRIKFEEELVALQATVDSTTRQNDVIIPQKFKTINVGIPTDIWLNLNSKSTLAGYNKNSTMSFINLSAVLIKINSYNDDS